MQQSEIIELARQAKTDLKVARGAFRKLAVKEGFNGASGGWIYYRDDTGAITQGWQGLADLVARGTVRFPLAEARPEVIDSANALMDEIEKPAAAKAPKAKPLSPAMQRAVRAVERHGNLDRVRDYDTCGKITIGTIVALMDRGIIRESRTRYGVHHKATTPAEVWDEAIAEGERRAAEQAAHAECAEQWLTTVDDDGREVHTRRTRGGGIIRITATPVSFRHWHVYITDTRRSMSAAGTWQEARRAADRFERERDHGDALVLDDHADSVLAAGGQVADSPHLTGNVRVVAGALVSEIPLATGESELRAAERRATDSAAKLSEDVQSTPDLGQDFTGGAFTKAVEEGWGQPDGMLGATEAELRTATVEVDMADFGAWPAVPKTAEERDEHNSQYWERATGGLSRVPAFNTPAEERDGSKQQCGMCGGYGCTLCVKASAPASDQAAAVLSDVANLRMAHSIMEKALGWPASAELAAAVDRIEAALRHDCGHARRDWTAQ